MDPLTLKRLFSLAQGGGMQFIYDDGGRQAAGYKGSTGDCVCRSVAIVTGFSYSTVYQALEECGLNERRTKLRKTRSHPRTGVYKATWKAFMKGLGYTWVPTMFVGKGCQVHLRDGELPPGRLVVLVSKHLTAVIDGVIHDTYDPSRGGTRCVYGYFHKPA